MTACAENLKGQFVDATDFPALLAETDAAMCLDTRTGETDEHLPVGLGRVGFELLAAAMVETG